MSVEVHLATEAEAAVVAEMAVALTNEISERTGVKHFNVNLQETEALCRSLIISGAYTALIATQQSKPVAFAGLCKSHALYTAGAFGIIQEFFVVPNSRSSGVGAILLEAVSVHARSCGWGRLELCTPPLPEFQRSLAFYEQNGFEITGGSKMKFIT